MTLKNEVKVKFDIWFGGFGYMFGVVYYSMLWPKTIISWRKPQGHWFWRSNQYLKVNISKSNWSIVKIISDCTG